MYLTTPQRYPQFKGVPSSPVMPHTFFSQQSPAMSFAKPFVPQNTYRPQPMMPMSQRGAPPPQFPYQRASTPQAKVTGKTVPSNPPPPQKPKASLPNNVPPQKTTKPQNPISAIQNTPYTRSLPFPINRPASAIPGNQQQMIQQLSKENQDLKKKLAGKDSELSKLKAKEELLEQKFKDLQETQKK